MKREEIQDLMKLSKISGLLEGLATLPGRELSKATTICLEDAAEQLSAIASDMYVEGVARDEDILNRQPEETANPDQ